MTQSTKSFSKQQEKRIAKDLSYAGGKTQPGSGALNITSLKADVKTSRSSENDVLVECKTSMIKPGQAGKRSITFQKSWIKDVQNHARDMGKAMGVVAFSFDNEEDFYVLGKRDFLNLHQALYDYEDTINKQKAQIADLELLVAILIVKYLGVPTETTISKDGGYGEYRINISPSEIYSFLMANPSISIEQDPETMLNIIKAKVGI